MRAILVATVAAFAAASPAQAANLSVFATGSMAEPLKELGAEYGKKTGDTFAFTLGTTKTVMDKLQAGGKPDVIVISADAADRLEKQGRFIAGTRLDVANALFGVAVKAGAPAPDIATPEAFKAAILKARSISYPDGKLGAVTGIYIDKLFEKFGIGAEAQKKAMVKPMGADVAQAVASGEVEIGLSFISEFVPVKGVKVVGPFPAEIQNPQLYVAAVARGTQDSDAARAFIRFVASKESAAKLKAMGVEPVAGR